MVYVGACYKYSIRILFGFRHLDIGGVNKTCLSEPSSGDNENGSFLSGNPCATALSDTADFYFLY